MIKSSIILSKKLENLKTLIENEINKADNLTAQKIQEIVQKANIQEEDLRPYADFDHPIEDSYGRKMIYDAGNFEIMAMSWNPNHYSSIHNHGYTEWGIVQAFGNVHHFIYRIQNDELQFGKKEILTKGSIIKVVNAMIHQMGNPSTDRYMTLHVYGCNTKDSDVTSDARNYELEFDRINHTTGGAFINLPADQIYDFLPCPKPTDEVFVNYTKLAMDYYNRQEPNPSIQELKENLVSKLQKRVEYA